MTERSKSRGGWTGKIVDLYAKYVLPRVINLACGLKPTMRQRAKVVPAATGRVLEVGIGSGLNLPYYDARQVDRLWGLDASGDMWALAQGRAAEVEIPLEFLEASADRIPLGDNSVDTVVVTYTLCSVVDVHAVLADLRRVLRPGGKMLFCEHGLAPDQNVRKWQNRLNPVWRKLGGGCNLNRDMPGFLRRGGFDIRSLDTMYIPGWKPASFNYWGVAV